MPKISERQKLILDLDNTLKDLAKFDDDETDDYFVNMLLFVLLIWISHLRKGRDLQIKALQERKELAKNKSF